MRGRWLFAFGALAGCGRFDFDTASSDADAAPDAPPLPSIVCGRAAVPVAPVPADADLAVAAMNDDGMAALWTPTVSGAGYGIRIDNAFTPLGPVEKFTESATAIGGVVDSGTY